MTSDDHDSTSKLPAGDLRLLDEPAARELLRQAIPAQLAYIARDTTPRVLPTWFHRDGRAIVMATWISGPHVRRPARRLADLATSPDVAISIDTDDQPPHLLQLRGRAEIEIVEGIVEEYRLAAARYLGDAAADHLAELDHPTSSMARVAVRPSWVNLIDFHERPPQALDTKGGSGE